MIPTDDLVERLRALGDALEFDDALLADNVLERIDTEPRRRALVAGSGRGGGADRARGGAAPRRPSRGGADGSGSTA